MNFMPPIGIFTGFDRVGATVPAADTATELSFRWTFILLGQSNMAGMGPIAEEDRIPVSNLFKMNRMKEWVSGGEGFNIPAAPEGEFKANAVGEKALGPSRAFGQRLLALVKDPRVKIQIINMAVSGSSIELWGQNEAYYKAILPYIVAAKNTGVFKGFIWHQGESNSGSNPEDYANRLRDLMSRIRTLTDVPKLPVVVGQVGISGNNNEGVNRSHTFISQYDPFFSVASSANLTLSDNVHYSAASYRTFGERFAERWWDIYRLAPTQK